MDTRLARGNTFRSVEFSLYWQGTRATGRCFTKPLGFRFVGDKIRWTTFFTLICRKPYECVT